MDWCFDGSHLVKQTRTQSQSDFSVVWLRSVNGDQEQLWKSAKEHMHAEELEKCLKVICLEHQLPPPEQHETFPLHATSNWIFKVGACMIKIFFHRVTILLIVSVLSLTPMSFRMH